MKKTIVAAAITCVALSPMVSYAFDVKISGQISPVVLFGGDVPERTTADNNVSGSRFRITATNEVKPGLDVGFRYELQPTNRSSFNLGGDAIDIRYAEGYFSGKYGKLSFGQGDSGANGSADAIYHNGNFWASANLVSFALEGVFDADRAAKGLPTTNLFRGGFDSGARRQRLRYDSPDFGGLTLHASLNNGKSEELAVRYKLRIAEGHKVRMRYGYLDTGVTNNEITVGSVLYETPVGIRVGAAMGSNDNDSTQDYELFTIGYAGNGWAVTIDKAENDANQEVTSYGANYKLGDGVLLYFASADFKKPDFKGSMIGTRIKF